MLILKILEIIAFIAGVIVALHFFNEHCNKKFSHRFFTKKSFLATVGALALLITGNLWRTNALQSGGDVLNGIVVMGIGILVALGLIYFNYKRTNFVYGVGGTVLQLLAFSVMAYIGIVVLAIGLFLSFMSGMSTQNVRVINR